MLLVLVFLPLIAALASWFIASDMPRRSLLVFVAACELLLVGWSWVKHPASIGGEMLYLDSMGKLVLTVTCILFFAAAVYAVGYLKQEGVGKRKDYVQGLYFTNAPEATFTACLLIFLGAAVLVSCTRHFGLLWVGIETTTLASAPLIYFHRHRRSLEATWKYLIICSVGMALALVGNILLDVSMQTTGNMAVQMTLGSLIQYAPTVHPAWFKAAFVFLFIGYGTKMGIAPMHTWLPDTYSEAPSISNLLSCALLNCAFLGIFRAFQLSVAADLAGFSSSLLIAFGLFSLFIAAFFIVGQGDFRRMLGYSSIEHMGILLLGLGVGYSATRGAVFHMVSHSFVKAALFLLSGNILAKYKTRSSHDITGLHQTLPFTSWLWLAGMIALTGSPPFALFLSEFTILQGMLQRNLLWLCVAYLVFLGIIFVGMITPVLRMYRGKPPHGIEPVQRESVFMVAPSLVLLALVLGLGMFMPEWLFKVIKSAASLGFRP